MSPKTHKIYIATLVSIVIAVTLFLSAYGASYYLSPLEERFYHSSHQQLKPSGVFGHGLGIVGTLLILIGVFGYMIRKRMKSLARLGILKYWLEFHIFLCTLGPIMVLFHTAFKFGGIVSISFWSMVAVVASGVIGRFIYKQIPRTIQGRELNLSEIKSMKADIHTELRTLIHNEKDMETLQKLLVSESNTNNFQSFFKRIRTEFSQLRNIRNHLRQVGIPTILRRSTLRLIGKEISMNRRIENLEWMRRLFKYWHVAHLPFAIIMLIIMVIHVIVTLTFGYKWIF